MAPAMLVVAVSLSSSYASAQEEPFHRVNVGLGLSALKPLHVSGGAGAFVAADQGLALGVQPYGEWRLSALVGVGLGVPATVNAPGATSNAYDIGLAPRLRLGYSARDWIYPFAVAEAGPAWSKQHPGAWLLGAHVSVQAGARVTLTDSIATFAQLTYDYTTFSGDFPLYYATSGPAAPVEHGRVATSYGGIGVGIEVGF